MENMAEELEDYKVFSEKEFNRNIVNIRLFETKIRRNKKNLADFVNYINSEKTLDNILEKEAFNKSF